MVSIVIPCYNSQRTIARALSSVINQTYIDYEVIVVDDGSTDKTKNIIKEFFKDKSIAYKYLYQENSGPSVARNRGVENASGEYIAFLDSDDTWHKDKLSIQMKLIEENGLNFLGSTYKYNEFNYNDKVDIVLKKFTFKQLLLKTRFSTPGVIIKKDFFLSLNGFDTNMKYSEDNDLWLRAALKEDLNLVVEPRLFRLYKAAYGSAGLSSHMYKMYKGELYLLKKIKYQKNINILEYIFLNIFVTIKFLRRLLINIKKRRLK